MNLTVLAKTPLAADVVALTLAAADGSPLPEWRPGAHVELRLTPDLTRQYSLCGDPADRSRWQVAVLRQAEGRGGSVHVHDVLATGDTLAAAGPRNHFPLTPAPRYLFLAGGIGITPILPMVRAARAAGADWRLAYAGRARAGMAFLDELAGDPRVSIGRPDLPALLRTPEPGTAVYACGPEPMLAETARLCARWPPGALRLERFRAGTGGAEEMFDVELALTGTTLRVPGGRSLLEVLEDAGAAPLSSCREGTCGTCETVVLDGEPDHRDAVLTPRERKEAGVMMVCVSRSRSPRLVLEL